MATDVPRGGTGCRTARPQPVRVRSRAHNWHQAALDPHNKLLRHCITKHSTSMHIACVCCKRDPSAQPQLLLSRSSVSFSTT